MSQLIQKKKGFGELPLYRSISMFLLFITPVVFNTQKDVKITYGYKIIDIMTDSLVKLKKSYRKNNIEEKLLIVNDIYDDISSTELLFKVLFELGYINERTQSNISIQIGDILTQLNGWMKSLGKQIETE